MGITIEELLNSHGFGAAAVNLIQSESEPSDGTLVDGLIWYKQSTKETKMYVDGGFRLLAAHGTYFTKFTSEHLVTERTSSVDVGIDEYKPGLDFIQVSKNGSSLIENIDYYVDKGDKKIVTMKKQWEDGDKFSFEIAIITTVPYPNNNLFLQLEDHVVVGEGVDVVNFNVSQYLPEYDLLRVHHRNLEIFKDIDWTLGPNRQSIQLNYKTKENDEFHFTVIKQVRGNTQGLLIDGTMLAPGSITKEALGFVVDEISPEILDGIVNDRENSIFEQYKSDIQKDKTNVDTRFDIIYDNVFLRDPAKTSLAMAKTEFDEAYSDYKEIIDRALLDMDIVNDERIEIAARLEKYREELKEMVAAFELALDDISANRWKTAEDNMGSSVDQKLQDYISASLYQQDLEMIKNQLDGNITSWFYPHEPMLMNEPAISWDTQDLRNVHLGDLFYDTITGYAYRFATEDGQYKWISVQDTDVIKALQLAAAAQDTADAKRRTFVVQPIPPYDIGDLWVQGIGGDILTSIQNKLKGDSFNPTDWVLASRYTDDSRAIEAEENARIYAAELNAQIKKEMGEVSQAIIDLDEHIEGAFLDGIVTEAEARDIKIYINVLQTQKGDVDNRYSVLVAEKDLDGAYKDTLVAAKDGFDLVHQELVQTILSSIADGKATDEESMLVDQKFLNYGQKVSILSEAFEMAINYIAQKKAANAELNAKNHADDLKRAIDNEISDVNTRIGNLNTYVDEAFFDKVIDVTEKESIRTYIHQIDTEKTDIDAKYTSIYEDEDLNPLAPQKKALFDAKNKYNETHLLLKIAIIAAIDDEAITDNESAEVDKAFADYRIALSVFSTRLKEATDVIILKRSKDAEDRAVQRANDKLVDFVSLSAYTEDFEEIQKQLDGSITSWFYPHEPTMLNAPANNWPTNVRNGKLGDLFYNTVTGYAYRFALEAGEYKWLKVQDTDVQKALKEASLAQDTADSKRRVFVVQPIPPYDIGDLWSNGPTVFRSNKEVSASGVFSLTHWERIGDVTENNTSADTKKVNGVPATEITEAAVNFNTRNDRNATTPAIPVVKTDLTAVDHVVNTDGSADVSFEWEYEGGGDDYDIDGFFVYLHTSPTAGSYLFGTNPAKEVVYPISYEKRAFIAYGVPADHFYTFGIQAYREVDQDIAPSGLLKSGIKKPTATTENPYRPSQSVAFTGDVKGTIDGIAASEMESKEGSQAKYERAIDEANHYTDRLRNQLLTTRTEVWIRHFLESTVFAKGNSTENVHKVSRGTLLSSIETDGLMVGKTVDMEASVHLLSALVKAYRESSTPNLLNYANYLANFITTQLVRGKSSGVNVVVVPSSLEYDSVSKIYVKDTSEIPLRLMYETVEALLGAFDLTKDVRYRDLAGEIFDTLAFFRQDIKNRVTNSLLAAYMNGSQYHSMFSSNGVDFVINENVFSNTLADAIYKATKAFPAGTGTRTNKGGATYIVASEATDYKAYIAKLFTDKRLQRTTGIKSIYEFMHYNFGDTRGTDGRYLPSPKNKDLVGGYFPNGNINTVIQAKAIAGFGLMELPFAVDLAGTLLPLRVINRGNDILFYDVYSELGVPVSGSQITLSATAAIFSARKHAGITEDEGMFVQTLKNNQLNSFERVLDGAMFSNPDDRTITDSATLAYVATTPVNTVAMLEGLDSVFADIQDATYGLGEKIDALDSYVENAFSDGIISEMEARSIEMYLNQIDNEKVAMDARVEQLLDFSIADLAVESSMTTAKTSYDAAYDSLRNKIIVSIGDRDITETEKAGVDAAFTAYRETIKVVQATMEIYLDVKTREQASGAIRDAKSYTDNLLVDYVNKALYLENIEEIKKQIDGNITTWFQSFEPTLTNLPAKDWATTSLKNQHLGDIFYNTVTGHAFRFALVNGVYKWLQIQDSDIQAALEKASKAQDTADGKRRTFVVQPIPPYDIGDLWVQGTAGDILTATAKKIAGQTFSSVDWKLASKYTDDQRAIDAETNAKEYAAGLKTELDAEIEDLNTAVSSMRGILDEAFKDGFVTEAEAKAIQVHIQILKNEKADVDTRYSKIHTNTALSAATKTKLTPLKTAYDAGNTNLIAMINEVIADSKIIETERTNIDNQFTSYRTALAALSGALEDAINEIATTKAKSAETNAKDYVDGIKTAIVEDVAEVQGRLGDLDTYLENAYKDNLIDTAEAAAIAIHIEQLRNEKVDVDNRQAALVGNSFLSDILKADLAAAKTQWNTAHAALITSIENSIVDPKVTASEKATIDSNFATYRSTMATLSAKMEDAVDSIATAKAVASQTSSQEYADLVRAGIETEFVDLATVFVGFQAEVEGAFKDGIVEEGEAQSIGNYLNTLRSEKRDFDERYNTLYENVDLTDPYKKNLNEAKSAFDSAQSSLIGTVNVAIVDGRATPQERANVNTKFEEYTVALGNLSVRLEQAIDSVASKKSGDAKEAAKKYADDLKIAIDQDIEDVGGRVSTLDAYVDGALQDSIITKAEKLVIENHVEQINKENKDVVAQYDAIYANASLTGGAKTNLKAKKDLYVTAFGDMIKAITTLLADDTITTAERDAVDAGFLKYQNALADFSSAFATAVNAIAQTQAYNAGQEAKEYVDAALNNYVSSTLFEQSIQDLQRQADGGIMTWFYNYPPTLTNAPAVEWTTTDERNLHLGDLFYDTATGYAYRYAVVSTIYQWIRIKDSDVEAALKKASDAQDTADAKRRTFVSTPVVPYDIGDLWLQGASGDIMRSTKQKIVGQAYAAADWVKASKYTDDARAVSAESNAKTYADGLKTALQQEISGVTSSVGNLDSYVKGTFLDGVIQASEAQNIASYINTLGMEKTDVDNRYNSLFSNTSLVGADKTAMTSAKTAFDSAHASLISTINAAIADGKSTIAEKNSVDASFATYRSKLGDFSTAMQKAIDSIATLKAKNAQEAAAALVTGLRDEVSQDLNDVNDRVERFDTYIDGAFKDGVIQEAEAKAIAIHLEQIRNEKADVDNRYSTIYGDTLLSGTPKSSLLSKKGLFDTAHTNLEAGINAAISDGKTTAAEGTTVKNLFAAYRTRIGEVSIAFEDAITAIAKKREEMAKEYVQSRGENLITNGTGLLGNNTNFSGFTFDGSQAFAGAGSFYTDSQNTTKFNDEDLPVDPSKRYRLSLMAKSKTGLGHNYMGFIPIDIDKNTISAFMSIAHNFPVVTLARDLKKGDTVIHLTSLSGFTDNQGDNSHYHSLVMWGYKNSFGYEYPPGTYTRQVFEGGWLNGAINTTNKTITLSKPFNLTNTSDSAGVFRSGHALSRTHSGGSYLYTVASNVKVPTDWTKFEGVMDGIGSGDNKFPHGTAFLKMMLLVNRNISGGAAGDSLWLNSIEFVNLDTEDRANSYTETVKAELAKEISDLDAALTDFEGTITTSFRDGVISEAETRSIQSYVQIVNTEKEDVNSRYTAIYANAKLLGTAKTDLSAAKGLYDTAHTALINSINAAIADNKATTAEKTTIDTNFNTYRTRLNTLSAKMEAAIDSISTKKATDAENAAITEMEAIQTAINSDIGDVSGRVTNLNAYLDNAFEDSVVSQAEARAIGTHVEQLSVEKVDIDNRYTTVYGNTDLSGAPKTNLLNGKTAYNSSHATLLASINTVVTAGTVTAAQKTTIATNFANYRTNLATLSVRFEEAVSAISAKRAKDAEAAANQNTANALSSYVTTTFLGQKLDDLQNQLDGNITTWFYTYVPTLSNAPTSTWTTAATKNQHLGDIFYNTVSGYAYRFALESTTYKWIRIQDSDVEAALLAASNAQDTADNKRRVFVAQPTTPYDIGDLWVQGTSGDIMKSKVNKAKGSTYSSADWEKAAKYTDDSRAVQAEKDAIAAAATLAETARKAAETNASVYADGIVTDAEKILLEESRKNLATALMNDKVTDFGDAFKAFHNLTAISLSGSPLVGAMVIETGIPFTAKMCRVDISGFNYRTAENEISLSVGFYAYTTGSRFVNTGYTNKGTYVIPQVRLAVKNEKAVIILGDVDTQWWYPKLMVDQAIVSHGFVPTATGDDWNTYHKTDLSEYTDIQTVAGRVLEDEEGSAAKVKKAVDDIERYTSVEFEKLSNGIKSKVSTTDYRSLNAQTMRIRYIRDWLNGSSANASNHWVEIEAYANGLNVAQEKTASGSGTHATPGIITDGLTDSASHVSFSGSPAYAQVDLGEVRTDLEFLRIFHYHADKRTYNNTKTEVSEDGVTWFTVFDSAVTGTYPESADGNLIPLNVGQFFVNYQNQLALINERVSTAEEIIDKDSITNIVMESESYKSEMDKKAGSDLSAYATAEGVEQALDDQNTATDEKIKTSIDDIDLDVYTKFSQLKQTTSSIVANFYTASGVNLIRNSVGYAGTEFFIAKGSIGVRQNSGLENLGFGSGFSAPVGESGTLEQVVPIRTTGPHTLSLMLDKSTDNATTGAAIVQAFDMDGNLLETIGSPAGSGVTVGYETFSKTFDPRGTQLKIIITMGAGAEATLTGLMLNVGETPFQWTMAPGEIYNTNVRMDMKGLRVSEMENEKEKRTTMMTPSKFAGYSDVNGDGVIDTQDGSPDEIFRMAEDSFDMKKANVKEEIIMGPVKMILIQSSSNTGWAFIPSGD